MKKKILFSLYNLDIGGIEKAMSNLLKNIDYNKYDVTILLQEKSGIFLKDIPPFVNIKEYKISKFPIKIVRKLVNRLKIIYYCFVNYHKYDFSCCYATYDIPSAIITRYLGKKKSIWVHSDYSYIYNKSEMMNFFDTRKISDFDNIIFVANEARDNFLKIYRLLENKCTVINNLIDVDEIRKKAKEKNIDKNGYTFVFIGRLEEESKKITRLIKAFYKFNSDDVFLWIVGNGKDERQYKELVEKVGCVKNIKFWGNQSNPYPYLSAADSLILTSDYEGFPVVYMEALVLQKQIVTTIDVSSNDFNIADYAYIVNKSIDGVVSGIEQVIKSPKTFNVDINKLNRENMNLLIDLMEGKNEV